MKQTGKKKKTKGAAAAAELSGITAAAHASSGLLGKRGGAMGLNNQHEAVQPWIAVVPSVLCVVATTLAAVGGGRRVWRDVV